jgi:hypothetical protein
MKLNNYSLSILAFIIPIIFLSNQAFSDFKQYKPATLDQIINITDDYYKQYGKKGFTTKLEALKLIIKIQNFPIEITEGGKNIVKWFFHATPAMDKKFIPLYTHEMYYTYKNKKFCFMFQKELIEPLKNENKIGSEIEIYAIFGLFNSFDQEHMLLVNGFTSLKK